MILLNVLIAQLSYTYSEAKKIAKLQYAADTMRIITRLEYSRFANLVGIVLKFIRMGEKSLENSHLFDFVLFICGTTRQKID